MDSNKSVAILVPIYNRKDNIDKCLKALFTGIYKNFKVVIIDDGSTDGSYEYIVSNFPEVVVIRGDGNLWWAGAINKGIDYAIEKGYDYVLTYNDDQVCNPDFLEKLMRHSSDDKILSSLVLYQGDPERILSSGIVFDYKKAQTKGYLNERKVHELAPDPYCVDATPGYSVLIPVASIKKHGKFDQIRFPQINMELEFSLRMKSERVSICVVPESKVWNDRSDKSNDPISFRNPFRRAKWFTGNIKSDLSFRQAKHLQQILAQYSQGNRLLLFIKYWSRYVVKFCFKSLFTKQQRKRITGLFNYNYDFWA
jgi:GT2 family glycosyltransferase